jgi:peptidoglycan/xylan/chitin deacetylase (PgdA/CDA1 family)
MLKVSLTHDVDRTTKSYQYITHLLRALKKGDLSAVRYHATTWHKRHEVYWNFEDILDIENQYGVKSTFFFLIESFPFLFFRPSTWKLSLGRYDIQDGRIQQMIQYLDRNGWEIGLHGSYASYNNLELLKKEKVLLESIVEHPVKGIRQHYLNLNTQTWCLQQQAGFHYDSSWGYTRDIGFKENKISPFYPLNDHFTVFPLAIMDSCYMNTPDRTRKLQEVIRSCIDHDAVLVINWHSNNYHEKEFPGWRDAYKEVIKISTDNGANIQLLKNFSPTKEYKHNQ